MKKFFLFMAAALVTFSLASCDKKDKEKEEPTPEVKAAFTISVSEVTAKTAHIEVTPAKETTGTYYWDVIDAADAAELTDDAKVAAYFKDYFDYVIEYYGYSGYELTYADLLLDAADGVDSYDYEGLDPNTDYVVIAISLDANIAAAGQAVRTNFKTPEEKEDPVPSDMTFDIAVNDITFSSAAVQVTPSNTTATYFWNIFEAEEIAGMTDAELCAAIKQNIEYTIEYYGYFGYDYSFADFLSQGKDSYEYTDLDANKAYTVIAVAMGTLGTTNGAVAKYNFQTAEIVAKSSEDITLTNARMIDACEKDGWWQMVAANADTTTYLTISPNEATAVPGTYSIDDMDADYTYIALNKQDKYQFATLDVEVAVNGETFTLTGSGIAMNEVQYNFTISGNVEALEEESGVAPAKVAPAKKEAKLCKKGNLEKSAKRSEKLLNR